MTVIEVVEAACESMRTGKDVALAAFWLCAALAGFDPFERLSLVLDWRYNLPHV